MTKEELIQELQSIIDEGLSAELTEQMLRKTLEDGYKVSVHFPSLDSSSLRPMMERVPGCKCPYGLIGDDGMPKHCRGCDNFIGYIPRPDGSMFAFDIFDGYCFKEKE